MRIPAEAIHAYTFDERGIGTALPVNCDVEDFCGAPLAWIHLDIADPGSRTVLENGFFKLDPLIVEALLVDDTRPRTVNQTDGSLVIVRSINTNQNAHVEDMVSLRLWVDKSRIISVQKRSSHTIEHIDQCVAAGRTLKSAGDFFVMMMSHLLEDIGDALTDCSEQLDEIEESVLEAPLKSDHQVITELRKKTIHMRRYIEPQKNVLLSLKGTDVPWMTKKQRRHLQESLDLVTKHVELIDSIWVRSQVASDEIANAFARRMNQNLYFLSLVAAVFLPLSFLTGLFGINVGGIPGAEVAYAFWAFCGGLIGIFVLQFVIFKKVNLFK